MTRRTNSEYAILKVAAVADLVRSKCIHLLDTFDWRNHICLVTPLYGQSVFDFLKENKFQPFPEKHIQSFAASLLDSLKCRFDAAT